MREYAKLNPAFWTGETGRTLKAAGPHALLVALYLVASPHSNALGLYYLPKLFIAYETGLSPEAVEAAFVALEAAGFAGYDEAAEVVFVRDMAGAQIAECLKPGDGRVKWVNDRYAGLPANRFLPEFYDRWGRRLCVKRKRDASGALADEPEALPDASGTLLHEPDGAPTFAVSPNVPSPKPPLHPPLHPPLQPQEEERGWEHEPENPKNAGFAAVWDAYPVKKGKKTAKAAYDQVVHSGRIDPAQLVRSIERFKTRDLEWARDRIPRLARFIDEELYAEAPREATNDRRATALVQMQSDRARMAEHLLQTDGSPPGARPCPTGTPPNENS